MPALANLPTETVVVTVLFLALPLLLAAAFLLFFRIRDRRRRETAGRKVRAMRNHGHDASVCDKCDGQRDLGWSVSAFLLVKRACDRCGGAGLLRDCRICGYNLTGNISGRCPECGAAIPDHHHASRS